MNTEEIEDLREIAIEAIRTLGETRDPIIQAVADEALDEIVVVLDFETL